MGLPKLKYLLPGLLLFSILLGCGDKPEKPYTGKRFTKVKKKKSGIEFENTVRPDSNQNIFRYRNFYNGGGVAIGDLNNDGLPDIYLTGNQVSNRLYLNKGELKFEDITESSGTGGSQGWATGVTLADVNADGYLDLYVCQAGNYARKEALQNLLYINNGDLTFTEMGQAYGLADPGRTTDAVFFDADGDNDLDLYVVNHPANFDLPLEARIDAERNPNYADSDHFYRNEGVPPGKQHPVFQDITEEAGLVNWAFGLSVSAADFNGDNRTDLYVACDFSEPDYYWVNQGNGTFKNELAESFGHISNFSMGSDIGDFNHDGHMDLITLDMMAKDNRRKKTNMSGMNPQVFYDNVKLGRHYQYMQNMLQMNNGNGTFSEIGELAGTAFTDWSWSPLFADFDNDGWEDILVTNGMRRDIRNSDFGKKIKGKTLAEIHADWKHLTEAMPVEEIPNFCFQNRGNLNFKDVSNDWGMNKLGFSTGAGIADLDLDGDLDLVLNNIDEPASLHENHTDRKPQHPLRIRFQGPPGNPFGIGTTVKLQYEDPSRLQFAQLTLTRGFQSASEPILHFAIPDSSPFPQSALLNWPDGKTAEYLLPTPDASGLITLRYVDGSRPKAETDSPTPLFERLPDLPQPDDFGEEKAFNDFEAQVLLPHIYSRNSPALCPVPAGQNGKVGLFVGGANGQRGFIGKVDLDSGYVEINEKIKLNYPDREITGSLLFDMDGDGDQDLYLAAGSNEWEPGAENYQDILLENTDGSGLFTDVSHRLPDLRFSGSRPAAGDFDGDGDLDLFVGGRVEPGQYPMPARSALLRNDGQAFTDVTEEIAPELLRPGMVTDAAWSDVDGDADLDLLISGEWMPLSLFVNRGGKLLPATEGSGLEDKVGWWYSLSLADLDGDGDEDFVAGNLGLNTKYQASAKAPFEVYGGDIDGNGSYDIVLGYYQQGIPYPVRGRSCSSDQMPQLKEKFPTYKAFGSAPLGAIYGKALDSALHYSATWMASSWVENIGNGKFKVHALDRQAQLSAGMDNLVYDFNRDGHPDILIAGNMLNAEVETCRHDASVGMVLLGDGDGNFKALHPEISGFYAPGDVKSLALLIDKENKPLIAIGRNNAPTLIYRNK